MGYAIRGDYTLKPLSYAVHHRGVQLVDIIAITLAKYVGNIHPTGQV